MRLIDLKPATGSHKKKKRVGRGHGCGSVMTCGRGTKGQNSRSGGGKRPGFEGGQTPWYRRIPKLKGFKNINRVTFIEVNLEKLNRFSEGRIINPEVLLEEGIIKNFRYPVKILGRGNLEKPLIVTAHKFTSSARAKIEAAGGKVEVIST